MKAQRRIVLFQTQQKVRRTGKIIGDAHQIFHRRRALRMQIACQRGCGDVQLSGKRLCGHVPALEHELGERLGEMKNRMLFC